MCGCCRRGGGGGEGAVSPGSDLDTRQSKQGRSRKESDCVSLRNEGEFFVLGTVSFFLTWTSQISVQIFGIIYVAFNKAIDGKKTQR